MSKAKRSQQAELAVAPKLFIDPNYMIALRSASGAVRLVDRNCALVSQRCRTYMDKMEQAVLRCGEEPPTDNLTTLFFGFSGRAGEDGLSTVPVVALYEAHRKRMALTTAAITAPADAQPRSEGRRVSSGNAARRAGSSPSEHRPSSSSACAACPPSFATYECCDGPEPEKLYPVIDLTDVPDHMLDIAVAFMYFKYRADTDITEKRPNGAIAPSFHESYNPLDLIAVSVILGL